MKQKIKTAILAMTFGLASFAGQAQETDSFIPKWVSKKGFWVVESNEASPRNHIIRFYNNNNELVYKETVAGVKLNISRPKTKMKLKKILESAVIAFEKKKEPSEEMALVKTIL